jgi:hypothetical protein
MILRTISAAFFFTILHAFPVNAAISSPISMDAPQSYVQGNNIVKVNNVPSISNSTTHLYTTPHNEDPSIIPHEYDLPNEEAINPALTEPREKSPRAFSSPQSLPETSQRGNTRRPYNYNDDYRRLNR